MASANNTDVASLQQALDLLGPALGILDRFNHRHKNQHRLSKWWAQFDMLRRAIRKLIVDLQACLDSHAKRASSSSIGGTKKKKKAAVVQKQQDDALQKSLETRARHVHSQLMPRAFLAFTQLAADNQYAHLGLALIGVLAQVNTAIAHWVPALSEVADTDAQVRLDTARLASSKDAHDAADLGIAVSRSDIEQRVLATASKAEQSVEDSGKRSRGRDVTQLSPKEEISTRIEAQEGPKKSKKRKDEFDNLFDSLEPKKTVKKKKKVKKDDEFDNLFSSLI